MTGTEAAMVRYIVHDVDAALAFYTTHLGFEVVMHPAPGSRCWPVVRCGWPCPHPAARVGVVRPCPTGGYPTWWLETDLAGGNRPRHRSCRPARSRAPLPHDIVAGVGGKLILLEDPSCNPIELFQPTR
jgi:catechol 2,3-dioxygenase-like lactoylglutathione lyase family enzyme